MTERPILFSGEMVRAILAGKKNQTRRIVKPQPGRVLDGEPYWCVGGFRLRPTATNPLRCPYGQPGDRLWVREAFMHEPADYCWEASVSIPCRPAVTIYRADSDPAGEAKGVGWKPSIHMPRNLSRIDLEIISTPAGWLNDISEADAMAEGAEPLLVPPDGGSCPHAEGFRALWESINGPRSWEANPLVWRIEFRRV